MICPKNESTVVNQNDGDLTFRARNNQSRGFEQNYSGALSFLRRRYSRNLNDVDVVVSGIPFDCAVSHRPGTRFGPRAIRETSKFLYELDSFPFGFNLYERLNIIDYGDCMLDPHHPHTIAESITEHARGILQSNAKMLTFGGDHFVA